MRLLYWLSILAVLLGNVIATVVNLNATKEPLTPEDVEFVEVIKKDLRRNNDDYAVALHDIRNRTDIVRSKKHITVPATAVTTPTTTTTTTTEPNDLNKIKGMRRDYNDLGENNYDSLLQVNHELKTNSTPTKEVNKRAFIKKINRIIPTYKLASLDRNSSKSTAPSKPAHHWKIKAHSKFNIVTLQTISKRKVSSKSTTDPLTTKLTSKHVKAINQINHLNKNKMERFKGFMQKNRGLFKNFASNRLSKTQKVQQMSTIARNLLISTTKMYGRAKNVESDGEDNTTLPDTDLLDMAPAKGGRISQKRLKGRLCHRHVLMPEGPKYDSRGRWYLAAHGVVARRPYERTRRPTLLLPRCCNCCKKSVLGCE